MKQLVKIGYIAKPHKLNGAIKLVLKEFIYKNDNKPPSYLLIEANNVILPFFIEKLEATNNNELIIKFEDICDKEKASRLKNATVFLKECETSHQCFKKMKSVEKDLNLVGYDLFNDANIFIAKIKEVFFIPNNTLAAIVSNNKEILLPLNNELIINLDRTKKTVTLKIPDGLLNLNDAINEGE